MLTGGRFRPAGKATRERNPEASRHPWLTAASIVALGYPPERGCRRPVSRAARCGCWNTSGRSRPKGWPWWRCTPTGGAGEYFHRGKTRREDVRQPGTLTHETPRNHWVNPYVPSSPLVDPSMGILGDWAGRCTAAHQLPTLHYPGAAAAGTTAGRLPESLPALNTLPAPRPAASLRESARRRGARSR